MSVNVTEIVKRVQKKVGADVDGIAGEQTWSGIARTLGIDPNAIPPTTFADKTSPLGDELASIAESQIGTQEDSAHTNRGDAILKFQRSTNLAGQGWPWCAAFVDWCVSQLLAKHPELGRTLPDRPQTASAFGLEDWGREAGCDIFGPGSKNPQRGDIVVFKFSHCGIVAGFDGSEFQSIEGNTSDGRNQDREGYIVARKEHLLSAVRKFIRLPIQS